LTLLAFDPLIALMDVKELDLKGVLLLRPKRWEDARGYFVETYNQRTFADATGLDVTFVQDNESLSRAPGTVRALHFQLPPMAQAKLVRVLRGSVYDVAVDVLGKPVGFDPRLDSAVRVHASRLRAKLAEYYMAEGVEDDIVVFIPKGSYKLLWTHRHPAPAVAAPRLLCRLYSICV